MNWTPLEYGIYRGFKLTVREVRGSESVLLVTESADIGQELGFTPNMYAKFTGWVPYTEVTQITYEVLCGELDGESVWVYGEEGDHNFIHTRAGRALANKWGLDEVDRGEWAGKVPKGALSRVWLEVTWLKRPE